MQWLDFLIVFAFIAYAIASGFKSKDKASENLEEYFLAGRSLSGWKAGLSMAATQFAADTPLLVTGLIATAGIFSLWQMWIYAFAFLLMGFVLAPCWRRANVLTDAELTEIRYGAEPAAFLRIFKALYFGTLFNCIVLAWVFFAAARIAEPFLIWNEWLPSGLFGFFQSIIEFINVPVASVALEDPQVWVLTTNNMISIISILLVTTLYSATGGLRSVVATDVVQFGIMMVGTAIYAGYVVSEAGGMSAIYEKIQSTYAQADPGGITASQILAFTPSQAKDATGAVLLLFAIQWLIQLNSDGTGYLAQRSMACKSAKDAKIAALVFTFAQIFLRSLFWLPIGLGLLILLPPEAGVQNLAADREFTFVKGIQLYLPMGVMGIMLTGMLAALASTVDTHLNWGSSYWTNDIYRRFVCQSWLKKEPSDKSLVWVARGANLLILTIALAIMTQLESIATTWKVSLLLGAGMGIVLVLRWLWWRMNSWAEITAIVVSLLASYPLLSVEGDAIRLLYMAVLTTAAALAAIFIIGPEEEERLKDFYKRVKPPGYWGAIPEKVGMKEFGDQGPARLWRGLAAVAVTAFSVFSLLVGIGTLIVGSPSPTWVPLSSVAWAILTLVVGGALIPVWLRLGFSESEED